jgi:hypothetical protein
MTKTSHSNDLLDSSRCFNRLPIAQIQEQIQENPRLTSRTQRTAPRTSTFEHSPAAPTLLQLATSATAFEAHGKIQGEQQTKNKMQIPLPQIWSP